MFWADCVDTMMIADAQMALSRAHVERSLDNMWMCRTAFGNIRLW